MLANNWPLSHSRTNKSSGRTNRLDEQIVSDEQIDEQIFRQTNRLIFGCLERRFFLDDLPVKTTGQTDKY